MKNPKRTNPPKAAGQGRKAAQPKSSAFKDLPIDSPDRGIAGEVVGGATNQKPDDSPKGSISFGFTRIQT